MVLERSEAEVAGGRKPAQPSVQITHLLQVAKEMGKEHLVHTALEKIAIGSIGPVTSEELRAKG